MTRRAVSPVLGVVLLVGCTLALGAAVAVTVPADLAIEPGPRVAVSATADAETGWIVLLHEGGDPLDVRDLTVRILVDGEPLRRQPPVPFFAAEGFRGGPTGAFNSGGGTTWRAGERAGLRLAATNELELTPGARVTIRLSTGGTLVATTEATA